MSRYSPNVLPTPGITLADALLQGVSSFRAEQDRREKDANEKTQQLYAQHADQRAQQAAAIQRAQEGRAADDFNDQKVDRPIGHALVRVKAMNEGVVQTPDGGTAPEGNINIQGAPGFTVNPADLDINRARQAAALQSATRANELAFKREQLQVQKDIATGRFQAMRDVATTNATGRVQSAKVRGDTAARYNNASLNASQRQLAVTLRGLQAAQAAIELDDTPENRTHLMRMQAMYDEDRAAFDALRRDAAPEGAMPEPAPAPMVDNRFTPGMGPQRGLTLPPTPGFTPYQPGAPTPAAPAPSRAVQPAPGAATPPDAQGGKPAGRRPSPMMLEQQAKAALGRGVSKDEVQARYSQLLKKYGFPDARLQ